MEGILHTVLSVDLQVTFLRAPVYLCIIQFDFEKEGTSHSCIILTAASSLDIKCEQLFAFTTRDLCIMF